MTRITFQNSPSTATPRTAENLNKLNNLVIQNTEPTTGEEVWVKDSKNLFTSEMELGSINNSTGSLVVDANAIRTADFIEVVPSTLYYVQNDKNYHNYTYQYDENKNFIQYNATTNNPYSFTTTATTKYVKFRTVGGSTENDLTSKWWLVAGTSSTYQDYIENPSISVLREDGVYKEIYNKNNMGELVVDDITSPEIFSTDNLTSGYLSATGERQAGNNWRITDYLPIKPNEYYLTNGSSNSLGSDPARCYYDANKNFISGVAHNGLVPFANIAPSNAYYMKESYRLSEESTISITSKSFDSTAYVLWTNPSPTASGGFATQEVTLNDNIKKYKYYEALFRTSPSNARSYSTGKIPVELNTSQVLLQEYISKRSIDVSSDGSKITFGDNLYYGTYGVTTTSTVNTRNIPYQIIAYK